MEKTLKVFRYTIHYLEKEQKKTDVSIDYSTRVLPIDEFSKILVEETHKSINESPSLKNTHFKDQETNLFYNSLNDYLSINTDNDFYTFSKSLSDLEEKIKKESLAVGGYYLFADYEIYGKRYISVILLRKKSGINIFKVGDVFKIDSAENINIEKVAMAFRLNFQIYNEEEDDRNYLAIITTQQNGKISGYFKDWVLAGGIIANDKNTDNFVDIVKAIDLPSDENGKPLYRREEFQKAVYDFVQSRKDKSINLLDLGFHFYGEAKKSTFVDYAHDNDMVLDPEFKRANDKWKRLITIKASVPGIELNVDYDKVNPKNVELKGDKIIIHSKELVDQIAKQNATK